MLGRAKGSLLEALDALPLNRRHWLVFAVCAAGFLFDSMDLQAMSIVAPVLLRQWALSPRLLGVITSAAMLGMLVGACVFGTLADRIGRRLGFQITIAVCAVFSASCAFAQGPMMLLGLRFCVGVGLGGLIVVDTTLLTEYLPSGVRGRLVALWAVAFPVGGLATTWLASAILPTLGWRGMFAIGAVPALMILAVQAIPETPRFLLARRRWADARRSADWIARGVAEIGAVDRQMAPSAPQLGPGRVARLFSGEHRRATVVGWLVSASWSFAYFGVVLWLPTALALMGFPLGLVVGYLLGFQAMAIVGRIALLLLVDRVGRRPLIAAAGVCAGALMLAFGLPRGIVGLVIVGYALSFCQDGGFSGVVPYLPELYPTALRSTGVGWSTGVGRLASLLASLLVGVLVAASALYTAFAVFAGCYLLASVVIIAFGRETKGQLLDVS